MNIDHLKFFCCPNCQQSLKINLILVKKGKDLQYGSTYCQCEEYPVIEGILCISKPKAKFIIEYLRQKKLSEALIYSLTRKKLFRLPVIRQILIFILKKFLKYSHFPILGKIFFYQWHRIFEKESLLNYFPLNLAKANWTNKIYWLDIGFGFNPLFSHFFKFAKDINYFAVEECFMQLFIQSLLFSHKNVDYLCLDINYGLCLKPNIVNLVTINDALPFIENQKLLIEWLTKPGYLKKGGFIFVSSIPEHNYLPFSETVYPLKRTVLNKFFPNSPLFFNEKDLVNLFYNSYKINFKKCLINQTGAVFRYGLIWPKKAIRKFEYENKIPLFALKTAKRIWANGEKKWQNKVY